VRLEQASVSLNDRLAGAAPDSRACITPSPLGRREAPRQRFRAKRTVPALARAPVRLSEWLGIRVFSLTPDAMAMKAGIQLT